MVRSDGVPSAIPPDARCDTLFPEPGGVRDPIGSHSSVVSRLRVRLLAGTQPMTSELTHVYVAVAGSPWFAYGASSGSDTVNSNRLAPPAGRVPTS